MKNIEFDDIVQAALIGFQPALTPDKVRRREYMLTVLRERFDALLGSGTPPLSEASASPHRSESAKEHPLSERSSPTVDERKENDLGAALLPADPSAAVQTEALPDEADKIGEQWAVHDGEPLMREPTFDEPGGYPSDETLDAIRRWPLLSLNDGFDFIMRAWHWPDLGASNTLKPHEVEAVHDDGSGKYLRLATGGWSGNEEIVSAIEGNFWMATRWELSSSGGLHIYRYFDEEQVGSGNQDTNAEHSDPTRRSEAK